MNKIFCPAPWLQISSSSDGRPKYCYVAKDTNNTGYLDFWRGEKLDRIRNDFYQGKYLKTCERCITEKNLGLNTKRDKFFKYVEENSKFFENQLNDWRNGKSIYPVELNLRFDNHCNLKCRMCNSGSSNLFRKEVLKNKSLQEWYTISGNQKSSMNRNDWPEILKNVRRVNITGGEPLVSKMFYEFLDFCIDKSLSENIDMQITTNGTNLTNNLFDKLSHFKSLKMFISIDGINSVYEYIRFPQKWDELDFNLIQKFNKQFNVFIDFTIQVYNYLNILDFLSFMESKDLKIAFTPLYEPAWFNVNILPKSEKEKMLGYNISMINRYVNITEVNLIQINNFKKITQTFDKIRNQNLENSIPELYKIIYNI